ncbi:hypothetical protein BGZ96_004851 [Linnemannia gamsii]|uniref:Uncharacterized protein n=1 Tax=Linnemannia gamsii TaxID=64522 RepID=A0ABQ7K6K2_9FUNG|nr:hypothetical protein BGZ96_004851 [Linnemannia gamsii]
MLTLPSLREPQAIHDVSVTIGSYCLRIKDLTFFSSRWGNDAGFMNIMERMLRQQLENLRVFIFSDKSSHTLATAAFMRHSEALCRVEFPSCRAIKSSTLHAILVSCRALEILNVGGFSSIRTALTLEDAVEVEWVCAKIRHLEITVSLTPDGKDPAYLADPTKATWTEQDHRHWEMMDKFYTQIGYLKDLQILSLKSTDVKLPSLEDLYDPFRKLCLPGLLALEDATTGQVGFLSRWSELSQLQELTGSFLWTNTEAVARMGDQEVEWFATHLPALRSAAFVNVRCENGGLADNLPRTLHELHRRRPEIQFDYNADVPAMF